MWWSHSNEPFGTRCGIHSRMIDNFVGLITIQVINADDEYDYFTIKLYLQQQQKQQ